MGRRRNWCRQLSTSLDFMEGVLRERRRGAAEVLDGGA